MDKAITINIRVKDYLTLLCVLVPQIGHDAAQLTGLDCPEKGNKRFKSFRY